MSDNSENSSTVPRPSTSAPRPVNVTMQYLPPPPPPPPPQAASSSVPRSPSRAARAANVAMQHLSPQPQASSSTVPRSFAWVPGPVNIAMQHLPLQPPPPPPAVPSTSRSQLHNPAYYVQSRQPSTSFANSHPPTAVVVFDATRPPPPIHTHVQHMSNSCPGNPFKVRRLEEPTDDDAMCEACVQREISIESYKKKMEELASEEEFLSLLLKKKENEYHRRKDLLRSALGSELFKKIEEFLEDVPQHNAHSSVLNNLNDSFGTGNSSPNSNQILLQLVNHLLSPSKLDNTSKLESSQSMRPEDSLRQTFSAMSRSASRYSSDDLLNTLQDMLFNEDRSSERAAQELTAERAHSSGSNSVSSFRPYSKGNPVASALVAPPAPPAPLPAPSALLTVPPPADAYPHYPTSSNVAYSHYPASSADAYSHYPTSSTVTYPHYPTSPADNYLHYPSTSTATYPPPRAYYPPPYLPGPRPSTSRAPMPPCPPHVERYPPPY